MHFGKEVTILIMQFGEEVILLMKIDMHFGFCASRRRIKEWRRILRLWRWILVNQKEV